MVATALRTGLGVVTSAVVGYYLLWTGIHLAVTVAGAVAFRRTNWDEAQPTSGPAVTVAVPAYDERATIVAALEALLAQSYPLSVVCIDDGSTDGTFDAVATQYDLSPVPSSTPDEDSVTVFEAQDHQLRVVRQPNTGKSAALNRALDDCDTPLFGVVDADTVVEAGTVGRLAKAFEDEAVVAAGGSFRVTSAAAIADGRALPGLPHSWFQRFQALDQLRAFVFRQLGRSSVGSMVHVFGAYSVYRADLLRAVGGFDPVETEDLDVALALQRHCGDVGRPCTFLHQPAAAAWTTVPTTLAGLNAQRQRWLGGTVTTLSAHRALLGRWRYGRAGTVGVPYFLFGEIVWPLVETLGYVVVPLAWLTGAVSTPVTVAFVVGLVVSGPVASSIAIFANGHSPTGYDATDRRWLLVTALVERLVWRPSQAFLGSYSVLDSIR